MGYDKHYEDLLKEGDRKMVNKLEEIQILEARVKFLKDNYPNISKKLSIGIKHKKQGKVASPEIIKEYQDVTLGRVKSKTNWVENRLGDGDGDWTKPYNATISEKSYIIGCAMGGGRILRQMEVLVDGQAVLCCDDATKKTDYGNVFQLGIENVWKNLKQAHELIYNKEYSKEKQNR